MAESDLAAKLETDRQVTTATIEQSRTGMSIAAVLSFVALLASIGFFAVGNDIAGGVLLGMPVVLLVRSFVSGSDESKNPAPPPER